MWFLWQLFTQFWSQTPLRPGLRGKKPFKCDICGYTSVIKHNLSRHIKKVHEGKKTFKCKICKYTSSYKQFLHQHIEIVHDGNLEQSPDNYKGDKEQDQLYQAETIEPVQSESDNQEPIVKKFECSICGKHVRHQKTLINHIRRVHTGMKPYQCSVCNQKCASQSHLNEHISSFHDLNENYV